MKQRIKEAKSQFNPAFGNKAHLQWKFSNSKAKLRREKLSRLEVKLKELEQNLSHDEAKEQYNPYRVINKPRILRN